MLKIALAIVVGLYAVIPAQAQNPVLQECIKINKAYRASDHLSFNVKYTYAYATTPTVIEDSTMGAYKMHGYNYWTNMDSAEYMQNDTFQVAVYQPEQALAIGLPNYKYDKQLPLSQWEELFQAQDFTYTFGADMGYKKITVDYTSEIMLFSKFEMWYDSVTYRVHKVQYKIDESASDELLRQKGDMSGNYIVVTIFFSNYQTGLFTDSVFNSANYFTKTGSNYNPATAYAGYEVFLISPALKEN
jgi:hypothetical protein